jgi:hypothetical protein
MTTNLEKIYETLEASSSGLCDRCLSKRSGVEPVQQVNQICNREADHERLLRRRGICGSCGSGKLVNALAARPESPGRWNPANDRDLDIVLGYFPEFGGV